MAQLIRSTRSDLADAEQRATGIHERMHLSEALRALDQHEAALIKGYPMALLETFSEGSSESKSRAALDTGIDFGELALVDDNAVMAQVELARAQQIASHATDAALSELNTYVSSAQGLTNVQPERNPLRPENYIRSLQRVVDESGVEHETRQLWMESMRELLGGELVSTYQNISKSLKEHGVRPVGYQVAGAPGGGARGVAGSRGAADGHHGHAGAPLEQYAQQPGIAGGGWGGGMPQSYGTHAHAGAPSGHSQEEAMLTVEILRQMLAAGGDPYAYDMTHGMGAHGMGFGGVAAAHPAQSMPIGASSMQAMPAFTHSQTSEAMEDFAQLERLVGRLTGGGAASSVPQSNWQDVSVPAQLSNFGGISPRSATDVLNGMMEHISQDSRLLEPVQRAVQNLEPALKRLVRVDPSFFSNEQHPARRLLDGLTQRSLTFKAEDSKGFRKYIQLVNAAVQHLATAPVHDAKAFEHVSDALESAWNTQVQQLRRQQEAEQNVLARAERQELLASKIAQQFRQLTEAAAAPKDILDFVTGAWARACAKAQIEAQEQGATSGGESNKYLAVAPQLLWCSLPQHAPADAKRMLPLMEGMFAAIRDGLHQAGHAEEDIVRVLKRIAGLQVQLARVAATADAPPPAVASAPVAAPVAAPAAPSMPAQMPAPAQPGNSAPVQQIDHSHGHDHVHSDFHTVHGDLDLDLSAAPAMQAATPQPSAPVAEAAEVAAAEAPVEVVESSAVPMEPVGAPVTAMSALESANLFELGQWIELTTSGRTVRTQLTWVSPHNTLFLFTAVDASTQSMTRRMLDKLHADGHVRRIDDQRVVARALGAVKADKRSASANSSGPDSRAA